MSLATAQKSILPYYQRVATALFIMSPNHPIRPRSGPIHGAPIVFPPVSDVHKYTMIFLHGRGSNASTFAGPLVNTKLSSGLTFQQSLSTTKFIFPTAAFRRATFANRARITQWFDNYCLEDADQRPELQIQGLRERAEYSIQLIKTEAETVGAENVILGGLSQGACTALIASIIWEGDRLGAVVGMAGRLPLRHVLNEAMLLEVEGEPNDDIVFGGDEDEEGYGMSSEKSPGDSAIGALREELGLDVNGRSSVLQTPIFLGHGVKDTIVPIQLGRDAVKCLQSMGYDVSWNEYDDLGHWYHSKELGDIFDFLTTIYPDIVDHTASIDATNV